MEQPIPARPEQAMTDPEQAYQIGLQDGYQLAKKQLQAETDKNDQSPERQDRRA